MNHTSSETPRWVVLTGEQVEALDQGVIVRAHRGDTMVQGPLEGLVGEDRPDVWVGDIRVKASERVEVRERDVPQLEPKGGRTADLSPQRLVSVRHDDLRALVRSWARETGPVLPGGAALRLRDALLSETR